MSLTEEQKLQRQLEDFARRLRKRTDEFKKTGHFSDIHRRFVGRLEAANATLRVKVETAARSGGAWEFTKSELWRDYGTAVNDLVRLEERLDAEFMKKA